MRALRRVLVSRLEPLWRLPREGCEVTIRLQQRALHWMLGGFLLWLILRPSTYSFTGLVLCGSLLLLSYVWARSMAVRVSTRRTLRFTAVQVGDELEEVLSLDNRSWLPVVFAEFTDQSMIPGHSIDGVRAGRPRAVEHWAMHTTCTRRGIFRVGRWETRFSDPFGLFEARQIYREPTEITVCPPLARIPPLLSRQRRTVGDRLSLRQALPADTVNAVTTRLYVHGEPLRHIHWRTSARHEDLFVRQFEPEASTVIWLIADLEAAAHAGQGNESSLEKMIVLAASLAAQLLDERLAVGLVLDTQVVLPRPGRAHLWHILRRLAGANAGARSLAETLTHASRIVSIRDSAVILTPSVDEAWTAPLRELASGAPGGLQVVLLEPSSFGGTGSAAGRALRLQGQGVPAHVVRREDIQPIWGSYDPLRRWEFKTLGTGRVVVRQTPRGSVG